MRRLYIVIAALVGLAVGPLLATIFNSVLYHKFGVGPKPQSVSQRYRVPKCTDLTISDVRRYFAEYKDWTDQELGLAIWRKYDGGKTCTSDQFMKEFMK